MCLFLPSTAEIFGFTVFLSTLPALDDFLQDYNFGIVIMGDFSTTKKLPKNQFISNISKNHEDETVYEILIKGSYVPMLSV